MWSTPLIDFFSAIYRKGYACVAGSPSNFSWLIPGEVAGSGFPGSHGAIDWLKRQGVDVIVSLTTEEIDSVYAEKRGMRVHRLPLVNMEGADPEALDRAVDLMKSKPGGTVLVHCLAGSGRTGMVLSAYLIREKGRIAEEAIGEVRRLRPGSLDRRVQQRAVREYEAYLLKVRDGREPS